MLIITCVTFVIVSPELFQNRTKGLGLIGLGILTFAMALMPIQCGDFFYYAMMVKSKQGLGHFEDFYLWLWHLKPKYFIWRSVVWGASTILLLLSIKKLKVNVYFASFIFVITQFFYFGTMRNMLGFMMMFFGVIMIIESAKRHNIKSNISLCIGLLCVYLSSFFHRSMPIYILLLIPAIIPFGKKMMTLGLFAFPILYGMVFVLSELLLNQIGADDDMQTSAKMYTTGVVTSTFMQSLNTFLKFACYIYLLYLIIKDNYLYNQMPKVFRFLTRYAYILIYVGSLFWGQETGKWLFLRFTDAGYLALMFPIMCFFYNCPRTNGVKTAFIGLVYQTAYNVLYIIIFNEAFMRKVIFLY